MDEEYKYLLKMILLGDPGAGKTSLRKQFMGEGFHKNYLKTLGVDISHFRYTFDNEIFLLSIWDLAGEKMFANIRQTYFMGSQGGFFVVDVTKEIDEEKLKEWIHDMKSLISNHQKFHLQILGNKIDLQPHVISEDRLQSLAHHFENELQLKKVDYYFTSALTGEGIHEAFTSFLKNTKLLIEEMDNQLHEINDPNNYPTTIFHMSDFGPELYYKDFDYIENSEHIKYTDIELTQLLTQLSISFIAALGQGHGYIEGCFDLPAGSLTNYRTFVISKKVSNPFAEDIRLRKGFMVFVIFIPIKYRTLIKPLSAIEDNVMHSINLLNNIKQFSDEKIQEIKKNIISKF